jgi:hypothetical protein
MTPANQAGGHDMSKQEMREEAERLIREAMAKKSISIKQGDTRIETKCGKCGAVNKVNAAPGLSRVEYSCKDCGHKQRAM